ncbi:sulfotransferase family protein [Glacieibacterium frigidum]|uniref:sulfotransferase family protein n=1 Tax=Glacieibacterium frigidum TaxID=2593303 RepID=UPI00163DD777|nr:sulfotransferase [Glacieibacterium frigidum]
MTGPIFIVGASRSGTELARSVLIRHPDIHIGVETHWFDDLRPRLRDPRAVPDAAETERILAYLLALRHGYGMRVGDATPEEAAALRARWQVKGPTADDGFAAHGLLQAERAGKRIWGEKTPRHLFRVDDMLSAFSDARVLVCMRDPRGVVASYRDWRNNWFDRDELSADQRAAIVAEERRTSRSFGLTLATLIWRSAAATALKLAARGDHRICLLRFEDLIAEPERTCRSLADWLDVAFDPAMLEVPMANSSYRAAAASHGFDVGAITSWRQRLTGDEARYIAWLARRPMARLGYDGDGEGADWRFNLRALAGLPAEVFRAFAANRARIGNVRHFLASRIAGLR